MTAPGSGAGGFAGPAVNPASSLYREYGERFGRPLSPRETEALTSLAIHGNAKTAAAAMGISEQTVRNLLTSAYAKLGADGAINAFALAGWLTVPGWVSQQGAVELHMAELDVTRALRRFRRALIDAEAVAA